MSKNFLQKENNNKVYIIAEIGINHNGSIDLAKKLIKSAKRSGADAVKFQTYLTDKRAHKNSPIYNILKKCELSFDSFDILKDFSNKNKIDFFSTPFDLESAAYLDYIGVDIFKIASFDVANNEFLRGLMKFKKHFILSTGMSNRAEILKVINLFKKNNKKLSLLHCVSSYPNHESQSHLACIAELKKIFPGRVGISDHTNDIFVAELAVAAGAKIIEKHFITDNRLNCPDKAVSITEEQMKNLVFNVKRIERIMGNDKLQIKKVEKKFLFLKRKNK
jgi:sialic acid synthase SpsE